MLHPDHMKAQLRMDVSSFHIKPTGAANSYYFENCWHMSGAVLNKGYDRKAGIREHSNETSEFRKAGERFDRVRDHKISKKTLLGK